MQHFPENIDIMKAGKPAQGNGGTSSAAQRGPSILSLRHLALGMALALTGMQASAQQAVSATPERREVPLNVAACQASDPWSNAISSLQGQSVFTIDAYGEIIEKAASNAGVDAGTLKALMAARTSMNPLAAMPGGGVGMAGMRAAQFRQALPQFKDMDAETMARTLRSDLELQAKAAAVYLSQMQKQAGGDMLAAVLAFDMEPQAAEVFLKELRRSGKRASEYVRWRAWGIDAHARNSAVQVAAAVQSLGGGKGSSWAAQALSCGTGGTQAKDADDAGGAGAGSGGRAGDANNETGSAPGQRSADGLPAQNCSFFYPLQSHAPMVSGWGLRKLFDKKQQTWTHRIHAGADIAVVVGTNVYAGQSGVVAMATTNSPSAGVAITLYDPQTQRKSNYFHLSELLQDAQGRRLSKGVAVTAGDLIARSGATGYAGTAHLHFSTLLEVKTPEGTEHGGRHTVDPTKYTCANKFGAQFSGADKALFSEAARRSADAYGGRDKWMQATLQVAGWVDGVPSMPPGDRGGSGSFEGVDRGEALGWRGPMAGGGSNNPLANAGYSAFDELQGDDSSFMWWLQEQIQERMSPSYYTDVAAAGAERLWAEMAYMSALKFHIQAAQDEMTRRNQAMQAARLSVLNQQAARASATARRQAAELISGK